MELSPDVEVLFMFNGSRSRLIYNGFRPMHLISENYLTTGIHSYQNRESIDSSESVFGTISFLTPEAYPGSCWPGKQIPIQEGEKLIGYAIVIKVLNPLLMANK